MGIEGSKGDKGEPGLSVREYQNDSLKFFKQKIG